LVVWVGFEALGAVLSVGVTNVGAQGATFDPEERFFICLGMLIGFWLTFVFDFERWSALCHSFELFEAS
jgi:hypothetical protein